MASSKGLFSGPCGMDVDEESLAGASSADASLVPEMKMDVGQQYSPTNPTAPSPSSSAGHSPNSRSPARSLDSLTDHSETSPADGLPGSPTGHSSSSPVGHSPGLGSPVGHSPGLDNPVGHSPGPGSPIGHSPGLGSPVGHSPGPDNPVGHSPGPGSPIGHSPGPGNPIGHSPGPGSPIGHSPGPGSPIGHSPGPGSPIGHSPGPGSPAGRSPDNPAGLSPDNSVGHLADSPTEHSPCSPAGLSPGGSPGGPIGHNSGGSLGSPKGHSSPDTTLHTREGTGGQYSPSSTGNADSLEFLYGATQPEDSCVTVGEDASSDVSAEQCQEGMDCDEPGQCVPGLNNQGPPGCEESGDVQSEAERDDDYEGGREREGGNGLSPRLAASMSETFLDNMNPQEDSQEEGDGCRVETQYQAEIIQDEDVESEDCPLTTDLQENSVEKCPPLEVKEKAVSQSTVDREGSSEELEGSSLLLQEMPEWPQEREGKETFSQDAKDSILPTEEGHLAQEGEAETCTGAPGHCEPENSSDSNRDEAHTATMDSHPSRESNTGPQALTDKQAEGEADDNNRHSCVDRDSKSPLANMIKRETESEMELGHGQAGAATAGGEGESQDLLPGGGGETATQAGQESAQAKENESEDEVLIIEGPPHQPIDTLIVEDDDDDDEEAANGNGTDGQKVSASDSHAFPKSQPVVKDGDDLHIVVSEKQNRDDSDRRRRRHERDRREDRRSGSHGKSSDRSSRRRHHRSRSRSRERRRKRSRSRSHSRERSSRHRRRRDRSRDRSADRDKSSRRKRRRDRSRDRRHRSRSRSHSARREDSWDKENRDDLSDRSSRHERNKRQGHCHDDKKSEECSDDERSEQKDKSPEASQQHSDLCDAPVSLQKEPCDVPNLRQSPGQAQETGQREFVHNEFVKQPVICEYPQGMIENFPGENDTLLPENIPIPKLINIPVPEPMHVPVPPLMHGLELEPPPHLHLPLEAPPPPPAPERDVHVNPPEPPSVPPPPLWRHEGLPPRGEGLLPTPIRRKAALEESARKVALEEAVYDPAHPTDDETERLLFPRGPGAPLPHPDMLGGPPHPPGQLMSDGRFVVPAPGEGGLLGPPPQRVPLSSVSFSPHRPVLVNHVLLSRPPFTNGPFSAPLPGSPLTRFRLQVSGPEGVLQVPSQFGQHLPPGPPPPPQRFPGPLGDRFEDGPPPPPPLRQFHLPEMKEGLPPPLSQFPVSVPGGFPEVKEGMPPPPLAQFPVSVPSGLPDLKEGIPRLAQFPLSLPAGLPDMKERPPPLGQFPVSLPSSLSELPTMTVPPPSLPLLSQPPPSDVPPPNRETEGGKLDTTVANLVAAHNLLSAIKDGKLGSTDLTSAATASVFKVPLPPRPVGKPSVGRIQPVAVLGAAGARTEDSTELMDMDMSPSDEDCELELPTLPDAKEESNGQQEKASQPLPAIDIKALSNAIKKLTSQPVNEVPASASEPTNKEKYLKKLHLQERVEDEVKQAIRPFYSNKKITKEEYKEILRKAVPKVCHSKSGDVNPQKIQQLVEGYVNMFQKQRQQQPAKKAAPAKPAPRDQAKVNGERTKVAR